MIQNGISLTFAFLFPSTNISNDKLFKQKQNNKNRLFLEERKSIGSWRRDPLSNWEKSGSKKWKY